MNFLQRLAARIFFGSHSVFESANRSPRRAEVPGSSPRDTSLDLTPGVRSELVRHLFAPLTAVDKIPGTAGIHITIGNDPFKFSRYRLTTAFFLQRAAARLSKDIREIVVFSDKPCEAVAMLVGIPGFAQYSFRVDRSKPCKQLRRMTAMQELVISNSALSWWAAWLGKPRKVIAPGGWFMHKAEQPPVFEDSPWIVL